MATFQKFSKEQWSHLTNEEKDFHTKRFHESVEKRKKFTIVSTRMLALLCIGVLFFIGYIQLEAIKNYNSIIDEYGTNGFCYLCGQYSLKQCECQYYVEYDYGNFKMPEPNFTKMSKELAEYNVQTCESYDYYILEKEKELFNYNFSK